MNELDRVKHNLSPIATAVAATEEIIPQKGGVQQLFVIADKTRAVMYRYATISSTGSVSFHAMSPFKFVDDSQQDPQYRTKTVYASVNMDPQQNPNNPKHFYNNNIGNFATLLNPTFKLNGKAYPNFNNTLYLHAPRLKFTIIPAELDNIDLAVLNAPALQLQKEISLTAASDLEAKDRVIANTAAYKIYEGQVLELYNQGLLTVAFIFINPAYNSVSFGYALEETMNLVSNPWMNMNQVMNIGLPISKIPVLNKYEAIIQIVDVADLDLLCSDNNQMLGLRTIYNATETSIERLAVSKVAIIKDYNNDTPILVSLTDPNNAARSRVRALEALLEKGHNVFKVEGTLSPIVRIRGNNGSRSGNVFFELNIDTYSIHNSSSVKKVMEADSFGSLGFEAVEGEIDLSSLMSTDTVDTDASADEQNGLEDMI